MSLTANQDAFAQYLSDLWGEPESLTGQGAPVALASFSETGLLHSYRVISQRPHWKPWQARIGSPVQHWWCRSLWEAFFHYSWPADPKPNSFQCIAERLGCALQSHDQVAAYQACLNIFRWGGVARRSSDRSRVWVEEQFQQKTLCQSIIDAVQLLQPSSGNELAAFDGKTLLMNAAMTKVYAAADPDNIIIYDGRVGAALGLLVRHYLTTLGESSVPGDLAFRWGEGQGRANRNPSKDGFKFPRLSSAQCQLWAKQVVLAGELLKKVKAYNPHIGSIAELEKSLFMIGFNVDANIPPLPLPPVIA